MIDAWHSGWAGVHRFDELRERVHSMIDTHCRDPYNSRNREELREKFMHLVNHYRTPNNDIVFDRCEEYLKHVGGRGTKNYNINKITYFKDIPDGVEVLVDYVDVTAIRTMNIPSEIIYESIYRKLPELFEE